MELTRAGPICIRYLENVFSLAESWDMTQVIYLSSFFLKYFYINIVYIETEIFRYCDFQEAQRVEKVQVLLSYQD